MRLLVGITTENFRLARSKLSTSELTTNAAPLSFSFSPLAAVNNTFLNVASSSGDLARTGSHTAGRVSDAVVDTLPETVTQHAEQIGRQPILIIAPLRLTPHPEDRRLQARSSLSAQVALPLRSTWRIVPLRRV